MRAPSALLNASARRGGQLRRLARDRGRYDQPMPVRASVVLAALCVACPTASAATYESLDGAVRFDAEAGTVALADTAGRPLLGVYEPPAPFVLDGQRFAVTCRAGAIERSVELPGPIPEPARMFTLAPSAVPGLPRIDLPECLITRTSLISDASGPFPQSNVEQVGLVPPLSAPRESFRLRWSGIGDQARVAIRGNRLSIDSRGSTYAAWADEGLGATAFVAVCDIGLRRVVARFPTGVGPSRRGARALRAVPQPVGVRSGRCRLGHPFTLLNERAQNVAGVVVRARITSRPRLAR